MLLEGVDLVSTSVPVGRHEVDSTSTSAGGKELAHPVETHPCLFAAGAGGTSETGTALEWSDVLLVSSGGGLRGHVGLLGVVRFVES